MTLYLHICRLFCKQKTICGQEIIFKRDLTTMSLLEDLSYDDLVKMCKSWVEEEELSEICSGCDELLEAMMTDLQDHPYSYTKIKKQFPCTIPGCEYSANTQSTLSNHKNR